MLPINQERKMLFRIEGEVRIISEQELKDIIEKKLNALIDSWPVVYGQWGGVYREFGESYSAKYNPNTTHKARLAFIEEIVKKPCELAANFHSEDGEG